MSSIILHGKGNRDENLDIINLVSAFGKTFLIMVDGYSSDIYNVTEYAENLRIKIIETGDIRTAINETKPHGVRAALLLAEISFDVISYISIGDCRLYLNGCLITRDGSVAWEILSKKGKPDAIIPELVCKHPRRCILTRFVSESNYTKTPLISSINIQEGDQVIFSTDGFWEAMHEHIKNIKIDDLFSLACQSKNILDDNYSMVCIVI